MGQGVCVSVESKVWKWVKNGYVGAWIIELLRKSRWLNLDSSRRCLDLICVPIWFKIDSSNIIQTGSIHRDIVYKMTPSLDPPDSQTKASFLLQVSSHLYHSWDHCLIHLYYISRQRNDCTKMKLHLFLLFAVATSLNAARISTYSDSCDGKAEGTDCEIQVSCCCWYCLDFFLLTK